MNNQVGAVVAEVMKAQGRRDGDAAAVDDPGGRGRPDGLRLRRDLRGARRGAGLLRRRRVRGEHVDPLRPDDPRGRPDDHVRQPRGRGRVHRLRPERRATNRTGPGPTHQPEEEPVYEKDGEKYFVVDSHMHFWDASPDELGAGPGAVRQGLDRVLPRLPGPRAAGDALVDRAVPEVLRGRPDEGRLRGRVTSTWRSSSRRT